MWITFIDNTDIFLAIFKIIHADNDIFILIIIVIIAIFEQIYKIVLATMSPNYDCT